LDLQFLYLEENIHILAKNNKINNELLFFLNMLEWSKNNDIFDVYAYMLAGCIFDMLGDVNNTIRYLENSKNAMFPILSNVFHNLNFIRQQLKGKSAKTKFKNLNFKKEILEKTTDIIDDIIKCSIERVYNFYFEKKNINLKNIEDFISPDFIHPLKIYLYIQIANYYFNKKNYISAEEYYLEVLNFITFHFEFVFFKLGNLYEQQQKYEQSLKNYLWIYGEKELLDFKKKYNSLNDLL